MAERKSRRRGEELERAILDAAWAELLESGYAALTIDAVAARAGTSKPVIYRRWAGRAELVLAAWRQHLPVRPMAPDTGDLRGDLLALFRLIARRAEGMMSETIAGVMGEAFRHPEVAQLLRERLRSAPLGGALSKILARAADRGELPPVDLPARVTRIPIDLIRNEAILGGAPVTDATISELVDDVYLPLLRGLAAG
ncbi:MAG TPA: TetR/AcrR family transcriptional regulator [Amycolatopsis sp.]|nr:TetR/AcrR family transcriptional regulator [Amycolatopsis sp.]